MDYFMPKPEPVEEVAPVAPVAPGAPKNRRQRRLERTQKHIDEIKEKLAKERLAEEARKLAAEQEILAKYPKICNFFDKIDDFCCSAPCDEGEKFCPEHL